MNPTTIAELEQKLSQLVRIREGVVGIALKRTNFEIVKLHNDLNSAERHEKVSKAMNTDNDEETMNTTATPSPKKETDSIAMAAKLIRTIRALNYGDAETTAMRLWSQLGRESQERKRAEDAARQRNTDKPDIFEMEMEYRICNLNNASQPTAHSEGMRAGFMYARAIYRGTRK